MKPFEEIWTKEFVEELLNEFTKYDGCFLCNASFEFCCLWQSYNKNIRDLAKNFAEEKGLDDFLGTGDCLFEHDNDKQIRIEFLQHEINRLKTLNALKKSIKKWEDIVSGENIEEPDCTNCPLCYEFYGDKCKDCPVMKKTGKPFCRDTPFDEAWNAWKVFALSEEETSRKEYIEAAKEELSFLKSLLTKRKNLI